MRSLLLLAVALLAPLAAAADLPTLDAAIASPRDLYAEAALAQPDGPTYAFFADRLPPLRYVDAPFLHYPITLSAPFAPVKARLVSNGSAINALARQPNWRGETGVPVTVRVGDSREVFGSDLHHLTGPTYEAGWLPIVHFSYRQGDATFEQEAFAPSDPALAAAGVVLARFTLVGSEDGNDGAPVELQIEGAAPYRSLGNVLRNAEGKVVVAFGGDPWKFNPAHNTLTARLRKGDGATVAVYTAPAADPARKLVAHYDDLRAACVKTWTDLLAGGAQVETPEPYVNAAWRATLVGTLMLAHDDQLRYSAGNQYAKLYVGEGGDAVRALALYGHEDVARYLVPPLLDYSRKGLEFHQAAFKLQMLAHLYWLTRDAAWLDGLRPRWQKEVDVLTNGREAGTGLLPKEKYCGDIDTRVYSLNSNANAWRALRDMSAVMADVGGAEAEQSKALAGTAADFRAKVLEALDASIDHAKRDAFVPVALFGEEPPYDFIAASRMGSYWNIMSGYVLGSGVFPPDSPTATALIHYVQSHGGRFMGQNRAFPEKSFWVSQENVNDLYGLRYALALLQRDEPDPALVCFYGKLAIGMTRDTFIGCEGSCLRPLDAAGRQMYLPPNSAANANFLQQLRFLLVQDFPSDAGVPDALRLGFATPRAWLADGKTVAVKNAPTAFGPVSFSITSHVADHHVDAAIKLPPRPPATIQLRLRLPANRHVTAATANGNAIPFANDTVDLTQFTGAVIFRATTD